MEQPPEAGIGAAINGYFQRPWIAVGIVLFGVAAGIASCLGLQAAIHYGRESLLKRQLCFYHPSVTHRVLRKTLLSGLEATYNGKPVSDNVVMEEVGVWNGGRLAIHKEEILGHPKAVIFSLNSEESKILDVQLATQTHQFVEATLDKSRLSERQIGLSWGILEPGDGILLRVFYLGDGTQIMLNGTVEGPKERNQTFIREEKVPYGRFFYPLGIWIILSLLVTYVLKASDDFKRDHHAIYIGLLVFRAVVILSTVAIAGLAAAASLAMVNILPPHPPTALVSALTHE